MCAYPSVCVPHSAAVVWSPLLQVVCETSFKPDFMPVRKVSYLSVTYWFCNHIYAGSLLRRLLFFLKKGSYMDMFRVEEASCLQLTFNGQKNIIICL